MLQCSLLTDTNMKILLMYLFISIHLLYSLHDFHDFNRNTHVRFSSYLSFLAIECDYNLIIFNLQYSNPINTCFNFQNQEKKPQYLSYLPLPYLWFTQHGVQLPVAAVHRDLLRALQGGQDLNLKRHNSGVYQVKQHTCWQAPVDWATENILK